MMGLALPVGDFATQAEGDRRSPTPGITPGCNKKAENKVKNALRLILALVTVTVIAGCATSGRQFDTNYVNRIEEGKTTEREVIANLGPPESVSNSSTGKMLTYVYAEAKTHPLAMVPVINIFFIGSSKSSSDALTIQLDKEGVVQHYATSSHNSAY